MFEHGVSLLTLLLFVITLGITDLGRGIRNIGIVDVFLSLVCSLSQTHFAFIGLFYVR